MATADELLTSTTADTLTVDTVSRTIAIPASIKHIGVESDDEVTRLYFKMPRYHNEIDLSQFEFRINYLNANNEGDVYFIDDVEVIDDQITFSWLIGRFAVIRSGAVTFNICLVRMENGIVIREFNTTTSTLSVLKGLETSESVVEDYPDAIRGAMELTLSEVKSTIPGMRVANGEIFNDYENNKALGLMSHAEGYRTYAGIQGHYYSNINFETNEITLTRKQGEASTESFTVNYAVGDVVSLVNNLKYIDSCTITAINNNIITVDTLPFTEVKTVSSPAMDDYSFFILAKPLNGEVSLGYYAHAEGEEAQALERASHAEGRKTLARGQYGHAEGRQTVADYASHAEGLRNKALGQASHAEGRDNTVNNHYGHVEGMGNEVNGMDSHAEGGSNIANGSDSHVEGNGNITTGFASHAEGQSNEAIGGGSHVEGNGNKSIGTYSHAEGSNTLASGNSSHSEGFNTEATGNMSHVEGSYSKATGSTSHAEGQSCIANGKSSHAEGIFVKAYGEGQHAQGKYNIIDYNNKYAHIVGNGTSVTGNDGKEVRTLSNAHTLDWSGNAWFAGDVKAGDISLVELYNTVIALQNRVAELEAKLETA